MSNTGIVITAVIIGFLVGLIIYLAWANQR